MGLIEIKLDKNFHDIIQKFHQGKLKLPHTTRALEYLSTQYQEVWIQATLGNTLDILPFPIHSKSYQRTIQRQRITDVLYVVYSDYTTKTGMSVTELLEKGHGLIDLKPGLLRGIKSRQGKNGRYNIVPFRHGTPGTDRFRNNPMPLSVYTTMRKLMREADTVVASGVSTRGGSSQRVGRKTEWGVRLNDSLRGLRSKLIRKGGKVVGTYTWKTGKYAGMVALQQSTTNSKRHGYMTFRVVSARSDPMSWIVPEQPPWPVRDAVIQFMEPFAKQILEEALQEDLI